MTTTTHLSSIGEPRFKKAVCFFAATLVLAGVCLVIAAAFEDLAVMPSMPESIE
jgi:hypothetical protein